MKKIVSIVLSAVGLSMLADPAPGVKIALELKPGPDNPRNSEGAFISLKDGRIMYIYSRYYGKSSSDHATADRRGRTRMRLRSRTTAA